LDVKVFKQLKFGYSEIKPINHEYSFFANSRDY